jgi:hypothetical protein
MRDEDDEEQDVGADRPRRPTGTPAERPQPGRVLPQGPAPAPCSQAQEEGVKERPVHRKVSEQVHGTDDDPQANGGAQERCFQRRTRREGRLPSDQATEAERGRGNESDRAHGAHPVGHDQPGENEQGQRNPGAGHPRDGEAEGQRDGHQGRELEDALRLPGNEQPVLDHPRAREAIGEEPGAGDEEKSRRDRGA